MIEIQGAPRSASEMAFVVRATPCEACGGYDDACPGDKRHSARVLFSGLCVHCGAMREIQFQWVKGLHWTGEELGGPEPSHLWSPAQFFAELERVGGAGGRAITCLLELLKFVPPDALGIPGAHAERGTRAWLEAARDRVRAEHYAAEGAKLAATTSQVAAAMIESLRTPQQEDPEREAAQVAMLEEFHRKTEQRRQRHQRMLERRDDPMEWALYAEWLQEEDDRLGPLIGLMLAREETPTVQLAQEEHAWLTDNRDWLVPEQLARSQQTWRRGHLHSVDLGRMLEPTPLLAKLRRFQSARMLEHLSMAPSAEGLSVAKELPLRSLELVGEGRVSPAQLSAGLTQLTIPCTHEFPSSEWSQLRSLTHLTLRSPRPQTIERLLENPPPALRELRLVLAQQFDLIAQLLTRSEWWTTLELVAFHDTRLEEAAALRLEEGPRPRRLVVRPPSARPPILVLAAAPFEGRLIADLASRVAPVSLTGKTLIACELRDRLCAEEAGRRANATISVLAEGLVSRLLNERFGFDCGSNCEDRIREALAEADLTLPKAPA